MSSDLPDLLRALSVRGATLTCVQGALVLRPKGVSAGLEKSIRLWKEDLLRLVEAAGGVIGPQEMADKVAQGASPWPALFARLPQLVDRLEAIAHPLLTVEIDSEIVARLVRPSRADLEAHARWPGMPTPTPEGWLFEALSKVRRYYPEPRERVALYAGSQPVAVVRRREGVGHAA